MTSKSGVYCGPLKLLAVEVFNKCNKRGTFCDLITGEDRKWASPEGDPSSHVSCTVEMTNISQTYEVTMPKFLSSFFFWSFPILTLNKTE